MRALTHRFDATVSRHPVGTYHYTVVYLDPGLVAELPLRESPRLRIEADVSGVTFKGAWQPAGGRWYLMLPKVPIRQAGLGIGSVVEVAFRVLPQDDVEIPPELMAALQADAQARQAWSALTAGQQRGLAHLVASAQRAPTRQARVDRVTAILLGQQPLPWKRR